MKVPGGNVLRMARRLISFECIWHSRWITNTEDGAGNVTPTYAQRVQIEGSVQPVQRAAYVTLGLDLQKNYVTVYTPTALQDLQQNGACDLLDFNGRRFNVQSNTDWLSQDGWRGSLCVDIGPTPV